MQTKTRRINITLAPEIIKKLGIPDITVCLDLPDCKETYTTLSSSPEILDWEFVEEKTEFTPLPTSPIKVVEEEENGEVIFPSFSSMATQGSECLITIIEATWRLALESPGIRFGTKLFRDKLISIILELGKEENLKTDLSKSTTRAMMKLLVDVFYNTPVLEAGLEDAYNDTVERLRTNYESLKSAKTLNQVMNILYRK